MKESRQRFSQENESSAEIADTEEFLKEKIGISPLSRGLKKKHIFGRTKAMVELNAAKEDRSVDEYLSRNYFSVKWGKREYLLVLRKPTADEPKAGFEFYPDGLVFYIDDDVPREFWKVILAHELSEYRAGEEVSPGRAHAIAITVEMEYAKRNFDSEMYKKYHEWQKMLRLK